MATVTNAPTPQQFADAWTRGFAKAVRDAAKDDTLTKSEAETIGHRTDGLAHYGDNATNYFKATGREYAATDAVIARGHRYAETEGAKVAGRGNRISLVEARSLPADLKADFLTLRGVKESGETMTGAEIERALKQAVKLPDGRTLEYWSESEYPVVPVRADASGLTSIDGQAVLNLFRSMLENKLFKGYEDVRGNLTAETYTPASSQEYLETFLRPYEGDDQNEAAMQAGFNRVGALLADNLKEFRVIKVGLKAEDGSLSVDNGLYVMFAVGRTKDNQLAGVYYGKVET